MNLRELRDFICESPKGQVLDSLICVELGLEEYEIFWQAHQDMNPELSFEDTVVQFLIDVHDYIGFAGDDIEKVVAAAHE